MIANSLTYVAIGAFLISIVAYYIASMGKYSKHVGLGATKNKIIPIRDFYADHRAEYDFSPSHDGKYVAFMKAGIMSSNRVVKNIESGKIVAKFPTSIEHVRWSPSEHKLRFVYENDDWEVDILKATKEHWVRITPIKLSGGWLKLEKAENDDQSVLTWGRQGIQEVGGLWAVSQDGLSATKVATGTERSLAWVFDVNLNPVLRLDLAEESSRVVMIEGLDGWSELFKLDINEVFEPVSQVQEDGTFFVRSSRGRDMAALVLFDIHTLEESVIVENEISDIGEVIRFSGRGNPDLIYKGLGSFEYFPVSNRGKDFLEIVDAFDKPLMFSGFSTSSSHRYIAVSISPANKSQLNILVDMEDKSFRVLSEARLRRYDATLVEKKYVSYKARDGLVIPAMISIPKGAVGPVPFIVNVHGGPADSIRDISDMEEQFFVNRGYGVLTPNYRGSTGIGKSFQATGFKEYGHKMQKDILDGAQWLIEQNYADPDSLIIRGESFGGYVAALSMTDESGIFKVGVAEFPMLDVEFQSRNHPGFWAADIGMWRQYFGDPDNEDDLAVMSERSPMNQVSTLDGKLLVLGGLKDNVTPVNQVRIFLEAARAAGKNVQTIYFPKAGHGLTHWGDKLIRARALEKLFSEQIGGHSGGYDISEFFAKFIR